MEESTTNRDESGQDQDRPTLMSQMDLYREKMRIKKQEQAGETEERLLDQPNDDQLNDEQAFEQDLCYQPPAPDSTLEQQLTAVQQRPINFSQNISDREVSEQLLLPGVPDFSTPMPLSPTGEDQSSIYAKPKSTSFKQTPMLCVTDLTKRSNNHKLLQQGDFENLEQSVEADTQVTLNDLQVIQSEVNFRLKRAFQPALDARKLQQQQQELEERKVDAQVDEEQPIRNPYLAADDDQEQNQVDGAPGEVAAEENANRPANAAPVRRRRICCGIFERAHSGVLVLDFMCIKGADKDFVMMLFLVISMTIGVFTYALVQI